VRPGWFESILNNHFGNPSLEKRRRPRGRLSPEAPIRHRRGQAKIGQWGRSRLGPPFDHPGGSPHGPIQPGGEILCVVGNGHPGARRQFVDESARRRCPSAAGLRDRQAAGAALAAGAIVTVRKFSVLL
jgi:hypothetical protein